MIKITYATYPTAFDTPGGGEIQLMQYKKHLAQEGVDICLFDPWNPGLDSVDIFHYFSCYRGSEEFISELVTRNIPVVLSPTLWLREGATDYPLDQVSRILNMAGRIVCNSNMECDLLASTFSMDRFKFATVYNGVDPQFMQDVDPFLFRSFSGVFGEFVLNVANVEPRKNQLRLIEVVKRMGLQLVMIGGIRDQEYFEKCKRQGGNSLKYISALPHDSELLRSAYAACSLFALPSMLETPGLAALEAACVGAKVVVTSVGCAKEYFQDTAIYVDPESVESIAEGIKDALRLPHKDSAKLIVRKNFTWPAVVSRLLSIYENRDVFASGISAKGFYLAEYEATGGFYFSWGKRDVEIICDFPGVLGFEWRALCPSTVVVMVNDEVLYSGIELGTEWSQETIFLRSCEDGEKSRVRMVVSPLDDSFRSNDPRDLGFAIKNANIYENRDVFASGISAKGFYLAEYEATGGFYFSWGKRDVEIICDFPGVLGFEWRALCPSTVVVMVNDEVLYSGIELGTEWSQETIFLRSCEDGEKSRVRMVVSPLDDSFRSNDPRDLGMAIRKTSFKEVQGSPQ